MVLIITHFFKHFFNPSLCEREMVTSLTDHWLTVQVSAAFLLFPQEIEIDVNSRRRRDTEPLLAPAVLQSVLRSIVSTTYLQSSANDLHPQDCVQVASCELARASEFPTLGAIVRPLVSHQLYERWGVRSLSLVRGQVTLLSKGSGHSP